MDLYFFKWFKVNFIHICNKLLALGNWIRHNLKDKIRNRINIILIAEKIMNHLVIRSIVIIYIYCEHQWIIRWLVISNNFHYDELHCVPMLALIGIFVYVLARMIRMIYRIHNVINDVLRIIKLAIHSRSTITGMIRKSIIIGIKYM